MRKTFFSRLQGKHGSSTELSFCEEFDSLADAIDKREIDAVVVGCETGFSEFGFHAADLASRLGLDANFMRQQAEWNCHINERVSLLSFSGSGHSNLRSLVLLPYGGAERDRGCRSYQRFWHERPSRDF